MLNWLEYKDCDSRVVRLPYPPSVNSIWRYYNGRMLLSKKGRLYYDSLKYLPYVQPLDPPYHLYLKVRPPDKRKRDLDNVIKVVCDSLQKLGVIEDDSLIDRIDANRWNTKKGGSILAIIYQYESHVRK